jgi:uncharacterized protein (TIGR00369 family)
VSTKRPTAPDLSGAGPLPRLDAEQIRNRLSDIGNLEHAASLLGFSLDDFSIDDAWIEASFNPDPQCANLRGGVQGGMICAMLDEVMSLAVVIAEGFTVGVPTLEIKISFLAPLPVGPCRARGEAVRIGRNIAFMEGTMWTDDGNVAARATATCQVRRPRVKATRDADT